MVLKTKLESTERVLKEWKTTGKALQGQVHRLTLQRNQEMLKQQKAAMELQSAHKQLARGPPLRSNSTSEPPPVSARAWAPPSPSRRCAPRAASRNRQRTRTPAPCSRRPPPRRPRHLRPCC